MSKERSDFIKPIHNLFPVSEKSAEIAFASIFESLETENTDFLESTITVFSTENKKLYLDFINVASFLNTIMTIIGDDRAIDYYSIGTILGYATLRTEAYSRGGCLPEISEEIIDTQLLDFLGQEANIEEFLKENPQMNMERVLKGMIKTLEDFHEQEPALTKVLNKYVTTKIDTPTHSILFLKGFLNIYSIFKTNHEVEKIRSIFEGK